MTWEEGTAIEKRLRPHIEHILGALLLPGELSRWGFVWRQNTAPNRQRAAEIHAGGDGYSGYLFLEGAGLEPEDGLGTFTDGFEDFISESTFAWGQQRLLSDRPWDAPSAARPYR